MPAIQAMRSDALALKSQEDVKEKVPSFINSVNQALGQSIVQGQDNAEQLVKSRYEAANKIAAEIRQKLDAKGGFSEVSVGMATKFGGLISQTISAILSKDDDDRWLKLSTAVTAFATESTGLAYQWKAAVAAYIQWTTQAGYTGNGTGDAAYLSNPPSGEKRLWAMGGRGAIKYRDAITPRYTDRAVYDSNGAAAGGYIGNYDQWYSWGTVGSITRIGQYA